MAAALQKHKLMSFMHEQWIPQSRAERLIASGRSVLAIASLGAIYLEPAALPRLTWWLLGAYTLYALGFLVWTLFGPAGFAARFSIGSHVLDLVVFGAINYLAAGDSSPFFVYFVFSIVCAILRFGRRGTVLTAVTALVVFLVTAHFALNRFVIHAAYLIVVASLLVYLADYLQRVQADLARIARW